MPSLKRKAVLKSKSFCMNRRTFIEGSSRLVLSVYVLPSFVKELLPMAKADRIAMGTVLFRYRFKQTKPKEITTIPNELTLLEVPAYYKQRFGMRQLEFWSNHFESLEQPYLEELRKKIKGSGSRLVNVQVDSDYDVAAADEEVRKKSVEHVKGWIDAVSYLGSDCVRVNPGRAKGSVEQSIVSMKEINAYAKKKKLVLLTENHFGIEMNTDVHIRIIKEAGPGIYTLPDFGNYPTATMIASLEKIMPYAYLISAKAMNFNKEIEHVSYDFDKCVQLAERMGFKGIYSVEQWSSEYQDVDFEKVADWLVKHVKDNIK
jgi:sugar phosphate isomerase/epimerase